MARVAFGDVGGDGACRLRHLVVLPPAGVVGAVEVAGAEVLRGQLYDIGQHPSIQPIISKPVNLHLVCLCFVCKDSTFPIYSCKEWCKEFVETMVKKELEKLKMELNEVVTGQYCLRHNWDCFRWN